MYNKICLIFVFSVVLTAIVNAQERAIVFEFDAIGIDEQTNAAATQILRNELGATGKFSVIPKREIEAKLTEQNITDFSCHEIDCAVSYGVTVGAEKVVLGSLTKLGEGYTVEVRLVDVTKREEVFTDRFSAISLDDLRLTLSKLAKALAAQEKIESEITRYAITEEETKEPRRKKAYVTGGVSLGGSFPTGDSYSDAGFLFAMGIPIRIEAGHYVFDNTFGLSLATIDPDTGYVYTFYGDSTAKIEEKMLIVYTWDMGLRYVFKRESDFSPFIGGGLGIHFITEQKIRDGDNYSSYEEENPYIRSDQAMALHLAAGVYAFQSYNVHVSFELKYAIAFTKAFLESEGYSHQIGLAVSITTKLKKKKSSGCFGGGGLGGGCL